MTPSGIEPATFLFVAQRLNYWATAVPSQIRKIYFINLLAPNDTYRDRTAPLTSKRCFLYIYSTNIGTEYFKHDIYSPFFFLQNAVCFIILTYLVRVLFTFYIQDVLKFKKNNSGAKRLLDYWIPQLAVVRSVTNRKRWLSSVRQWALLLPYGLLEVALAWFVFWNAAPEARPNYHTCATLRRAGRSHMNYSPSMPPVAVVPPPAHLYVFPNHSSHSVHTNACNDSDKRFGLVDGSGGWKWFIR